MTEPDAGGPPLEGAHLLLTGATGFIGQGLLEKLLSQYPGTRISVLVRPKGTTTGRQRIDKLMSKPVFRTWRKQVGSEEVRRAVAERVTVLEGDLDDMPELPGDLDVVIHGASTVSFDLPIDEAFGSNVSGAVQLYQALAASGADAHVVHLSTAYVAGLRKGVVPEAQLSHHVDWRAERVAAEAARADVETESRRPEVLREVMAAAQSEHGKAGPQAAATAAEEGRVAWVHRRLVDYGMTRAQSLGWPDVYTLTKALGERTAEDLWAGSGHRLSVVRPTIVESALTHPYPGWLDGFKVADPLIMAYGRGLLPEFPGLADSVLDVIPVDLVINCVLAAAASPPAAGEPAYFHISSGASNPLTFRGMYQNVHDYFCTNPLPDGKGGHIQVEEWTFPRKGQIERGMQRRQKALGLAEMALAQVPSSPRTREWVSQVHRGRTGLASMHGYAHLYQPYTQSEVIYDDRGTRALHHSLPADRRDAHGFDVTGIDWDDYMQHVHIPSVTTLVHAYSGRSTLPPVTAPVAELEQRTDVAAFFDLQGTVVNSTLVEQYLWTAMARLPRSQWPAELVDLLRSSPGYLRAERRDRGEFIRAFMRRYEGIDEAELRGIVKESIGGALQARTIPEAQRTIEMHRAAGHRTVLITGAADMFVEPIAPLFDDVASGHLHVEDGVLSGHLASPPLVDEARAAWLRSYAKAEGLDLSGSYAYGDSYADRAWLELVGNPRAVNPDKALFRHAKRRHWQIHTWPRASREARGRWGLLAGLATGKGER